MKFLAVVTPPFIYQHQSQGASGASLLSLWVGKVEGEPKESGTCGGCYWFILKGLRGSHEEGGWGVGSVVTNDMG